MPPPDTLPEARAISLLPPNAGSAEVALEEALRSRIDLAAVGTLWDPATCPAEVLPFLAWGLAISHWDPDWTVAEKRAAVAGAIPFHRIKGTRAAVEQVLARFHPLLELVEWWQQNPPGAPHTFQVRAPAPAIPASFLDQATAAAIIRDVAQAKPLRAHFDFVQTLELEASFWLAGGMLVGTQFRSDFAAVHDPDPVWLTALLTEDGEPLYAEDGVTLLEAS